jgi:hypothetical protein
MAVFNIVHITKYQYTEITESKEIKLFPYNFENQVLQFQLSITKIQSSDF